MPAQSFHPYLWYREVIAMDYFIRMHVCAYLYLSMYSLYFPLAISHLITRRARTDRPSKGRTDRRTDALDCILVIQHHHNFHFSHKNSHQKQRKEIQSKKVTSAVNNLHPPSIYPSTQPANRPTFQPSTHHKTKVTLFCWGFLRLSQQNLEVQSNGERRAIECIMPNSEQRIANVNDMCIDLRRGGKV